jgi:hypothetical protein
MTPTSRRVVQISCMNRHVELKSGRGEWIWSTGLLVPNQKINQLESLSWRRLLVFGSLSNGQVWTSKRHGVHRTRRIFCEELFWFDDA